MRYIGKDGSEIRNLATQVPHSQNENCGEVKDLGLEMGSIHNQVSLGTCFSYAAADLLSFKLRRKISAASLAVQSNKERNPLTDRLRSNIKESSSIEGGMMGDAINAGIKNGLCLERDFPSEYSGDGRKSPRDLRDFIVLLENETSRRSNQRPSDRQALPLSLISAEQSGNLPSLEKNYR